MRSLRPLGRREERRLAELNEDWDRRLGVWFRKDSAADLAALGLDSPGGADAFRGGDQLRRYPEKSILRFEFQGRVCFLKRYHYGRASVALRALAKLNFPTFSGPIEMANLLELATAGFRVPIPIAAGSGGSQGRALSYLIIEELAGQPVSTLSEHSEAEHRDLAGRLGELVAALHNRGFAHRDLYLCNLFESGQGLGLLDCERVRRRAKSPSRKDTIRDLSALLYSSKELASPRDRRRFLVRYLRCREAQSPFDRGLLSSVPTRAARIARRGRK